MAGMIQAGSEPSSCKTGGLVPAGKHWRADQDNQRRELEEVAQRSGWKIVAVYEDASISGARGRDKRPAFDKLNKDAARRKFKVVMAWSVDRLGRSLQDLVAFLNELRDLKVDLFLHKQGMDTTTPGGRMLFQMCGVFAEFERAMISERVRAGLERVRANGPAKGKKAIGRPLNTDPALAERVQQMRADGIGLLKIGRTLGIGTGLVQRLALLKSSAPQACIT
jgi:DNA invertase Pin-like site-specific DNA recombinase